MYHLIVVDKKKKQKKQAFLIPDVPRPLTKSPVADLQEGPGQPLILYIKKNK